MIILELSHKKVIKYLNFICNSTFICQKRSFSRMITLIILETGVIILETGVITLKTQVSTVRNCTLPLL